MATKAHAKIMAGMMDISMFMGQADKQAPLTKVPRSTRRRMVTWMD